MLAALSPAALDNTSPDLEYKIFQQYEENKLPLKKTNQTNSNNNKTKSKQTKK